MQNLSKIIINLISGIFIGAATLFIITAATIGYAYTTNNEVHMPGIIHAWFTTENDMPALNFTPNFTGITISIIAIAIIFSIISTRKQKNDNKKINIHE